MIRQLHEVYIGRINELLMQKAEIMLSLQAQFMQRRQQISTELAQHDCALKNQHYSVKIKKSSSLSHTHIVDDLKHESNANCKEFVQSIHPNEIPVLGAMDLDDDDDAGARQSNEMNIKKHHGALCDNSPGLAGQEPDNANKKPFKCFQ